MSEQPEITPPATQTPTPSVTAADGTRRTWLNYYAQELLGPISKLTRRCELCGRRLWRGYLLQRPAVITGDYDMRIVCWRCKLAAARQHMERLRAARR